MNTVVAIIIAVIAYIGSIILALLIGMYLMYAHFKGIDKDDLEYIDENRKAIISISGCVSVPSAGSRTRRG